MSFSLWAGELNQVWTNLIANAAEAMDGEGTLEICTYTDGGDVVVEVDGRSIRNPFDFYQAMNGATGRTMKTKVFRQNNEVEMELETK